MMVACSLMLVFVAIVLTCFFVKECMQTYVFQLYRRTRNKSSVIISTLAIERRCVCPFRERLRVAKEYPQWAVGVEFISGTDKEYRLTFDEATDIYPPMFSLRDEFIDEDDETTR